MNLHTGKFSVKNQIPIPAKAMSDGRKSRRPSKRQAILEAALALYADGGFRGTGLTAIGARAGVTHAAVLYHFESAANLLRAVIEERDRRFNESSADLFTGDALEGLARLPEIAHFNIQHSGLARLHTVLTAENLDPESPAHDWFNQRSRAIHRMFVRLIEKGVDAGELRADLDVDVEASAIIAFMEGAQMQYLLDPDRVDLVSLYENYTHRLIRDLSAGANS